MAQKPKAIDCQEVMRSLFLYLDHEVDEMTDAEISEHLNQCHSCLSRVNFEKNLENSIREAEEEKASEKFKDRVSGILKDL